MDTTKVPWSKKGPPREKQIRKNEFLARSVVRALKNTSRRNIFWSVRILEKKQHHQNRLRQTRVMMHLNSVQENRSCHLLRLKEKRLQQHEK